VTQVPAAGCRGYQGGLQAALSNGRGRCEPPGCWVQGPSSPQQVPGKVGMWSLLIQLTTWERNTWQQRQTKKEKSDDLELKADISRKQV